MRFIKLAIISIVLLSLLVLAISSLVPSRIIVRRSIDINAPVDSIYKRVSDLNEWKRWLINRDSMQVSVTDDGGKQTLIMGNTKINMVSAKPDEIKTNWQVEKGKVLPCYINLIVNKNTPITTIQWQFNQEVKWYPWEKFSAMISDKVLGPFIEQSLQKLKESSEGEKL